MHFIVPCSATKCAPASPSLDAATICAPNLRAFARAWAARLSAARPECPAEAMYRGSGTHAAKAAAELHHARLSFLSAGLGWVPGHRPIPSYNLTLAASGPSPLVAVGGGTPADWWAALGEFVQPTRHRLTARYPAGQEAIFALSGVYLRMILPELATLDRRTLQRFTLIVCSEVALPASVKDRVIRYDARLGHSPLGFAGAHASAPQRALRHYAALRAEHPRARSLTALRALVERDLALAAPPSRASRAASDDTTLRERIADALRDAPASASALLKRFRDAGIACEQRRFATIYRSVVAP